MWEMRTRRKRQERENRFRNSYSMRGYPLLPRHTKTTSHIVLNLSTFPQELVEGMPLELFALLPRTARHSTYHLRPWPINSRAHVGSGREGATQQVHHWCTSFDRLLTLYQIVCRLAQVLDWAQLSPVIPTIVNIRGTCTAADARVKLAWPETRIRSLFPQIQLLRVRSAATVES